MYIYAITRVRFIYRRQQDRDISSMHVSLGKLVVGSGGIPSFRASSSGPRR